MFEYLKFKNYWIISSYNIQEISNYFDHMESYFKRIVIDKNIIIN